jgi:uncharacterized protein
MPLRLRLWGGEPLLYFEMMREVVEKTKDCNISYGFTTNGSLLTPQIVDYLNDHDFKVTLSNDGKDTDRVRAVNVLEDPGVIALFNRLRHGAVNMVLSAYAQDVFAVWNYIFDKLGRDVTINTEFLMADPDTPEDLTAYDFAAFKQTMDDVIAHAYNCHLINSFSPAAHWLTMFTLNALVVLLNRLQNPKMLECRQVYQTINLDCSGLIYPCHNYGEAIADVSMTHDEIIAAYNEKIPTVTTFAQCAACDVFPLCRGYCPFINPSAAKEKTCEIRRIFFRAIVRYINLLSEGGFVDDKGSCL